MTHLNPHRSDDDEIFQKYLDRAISDFHELWREVGECSLCEHPLGFSPVLGTGHPLADIFLLKYQPKSTELDEGVAFFGRSGEAIRASIGRLNVNPLDIYGTNCIKCSQVPSSCMQDKCPSWLERELSIVTPKLVVAMGESAIETMNGLGMEDARELTFTPGTIQRWRPACDVIACPDIDDSLEGAAAKQAFWVSFRMVGEWYADKPPY
jgi:uracil-DNA glycosylase family 4